MLLRGAVENHAAVGGGIVRGEVVGGVGGQGGQGGQGDGVGQGTFSEGGLAVG